MEVMQECVMVRKYGRTKGVTTWECVTGKRVSIQRRLSHGPIADTLIILMWHSSLCYRVAPYPRHHHVQSIV